MDVPLVKKCRDRSTTFGEAWERVAHLLLIMDGRTSTKLRAEWEDPAPSTEREKAETAGLHRQAGLPKTYVFRHDLGLEGDELAAVLADAQAEQDLATPALGNPFGGLG